MTRESMRKLKAEIHKELVDFIFEEADTDDEMDELWLYVIELAQKELEWGNKQTGENACSFFVLFSAARKPSVRAEFYIIPPRQRFVKGFLKNF